MGGTVGRCTLPRPRAGLESIKCRICPPKDAGTGGQRDVTYDLLVYTGLAVQDLPNLEHQALGGKWFLQEEAFDLPSPGCSLSPSA